MPNTPKRTTADLSAYPDLVVIYLGMRVEEPRGFETMYVDVDDPVGLARFAPSAVAHGPMFSARQRRDADRSSAAAS
jgi:hypothetical protein